MSPRATLLSSIRRMVERLEAVEKEIAAAEGEGINPGWVGELAEIRAYGGDCLDHLARGWGLTPTQLRLPAMHAEQQCLLDGCGCHDAGDCGVRT